MNGKPTVEAHPSSLPVDTVVDQWRVVGWGGNGTYGTVYRAVQVGRKSAGPVALKVATHAGDPRFAREVGMLQRLHHAHVPGLLDHGFLRYQGRPYPYVVMQWVQGVGLYDWASQHNPTSREVLQLMAQLAWALDAVHAARGVHRDMKGGNVLVRADAQAFLTDFGSSIYAGADPLTLEPLPPGTAAYRCPEAWSFALTDGMKWHARYSAQPADDVFALGVTAYRLVTDEYPPPTDPGAAGSHRWYAGRGEQPPLEESNPRVAPGLRKLILQMLSVSPKERGPACELALACEHEAERAGPEADQLLFEWETLPTSAWTRVEADESRARGHRLRRRDRDNVQEAAKREADQSAEAARWEAELARARALTEAGEVSARPQRWQSVLALVGMCLLILLSTRQAAHGPLGELPSVAQTEATDEGSRDGGIVGLGQEVLTAPMGTVTVPYGSHHVTVDVPKSPFPGQRRPDIAGKCRLPREVAINGGCWIPVYPPCEKDAYKWEGRCYYPSYDAPRQPSSDKP